MKKMKVLLRFIKFFTEISERVIINLFRLSFLHLRHFHFYFGFYLNDFLGSSLYDITLNRFKP